MTGRRLDPPIGDGSGYMATWNDLRLLGIGKESIVAFQNRLRPLGFDRDEWFQFKETLDLALKNDGVSRAEIRILGSAAQFFSSAHKTMPYTPEEVALRFKEVRGRMPTRFELDRIKESLRRAWPYSNDRPRQRPFDVFYQLRIARYRSDIDVQISSAEIENRAYDALDALGLTPEEFLVLHPKYSFINKEIISTICPYLTAWAVLQSDVLPRPVTVAVIPSPSSPRLNPSRAKDRDGWLVPLGAGG